MNEQSDNHPFAALDPVSTSAVKAVLAEPVPFDAVERVKARAAQIGAATVSPRTLPTRSREWLLPWVRYGGIVAAVLVLASMTTFLLLMDHTAVRAFADVIQSVKQADTVQLTMTTQFGRQPETQGKMYLEAERWRVEQFHGFGGLLIQVGDLNRKQALILDTHRKLAQSIDIDEQFVKSFSDPIDQLRRAKPEDAENIGEEYLGGRITQIYRMHKVDLLGIRGAAEMLVWVDPKDGLPVKIVIHDRDPKAKTMIRFEDLRWNEPIDTKLFALDLPEGFQSGKVMTVPRAAESAQPSDPVPVTPSELSAGILSRDRVPGRIVWGPQGATITATMRDPESTATLERKREELRRWNVANGELMWSVEYHGSFSLAAAANGKRLATVEGYELQLRNPDTGQVTQKWPTEKQLSPLAFSPDGRTLAAGIAEWGQQPNGRGQEGGVQFWDVAHGTLKRSLSDDKPTTFVRYSRDGKHLASAPNGGPVKVWKASTGELVRIFPYGGKFDFSPYGKLIACMASQQRDGDTPDDVRKRYDVQIYELQTGKLMKTLVSNDHTKESYVLWIEFSPDGSLVAAANWDGTAKLWDVATGELLKTITEHNAGVGAAVFSPDGSTMASGSEDKMLRLWNIQQLVSP